MATEPDPLPTLDLPVVPPVEPMLAKAAKALPDGDDWWFEPKWDGFRCIAFRDGGTVYLQSRNKRPFNRYFPDVVAALLATLPNRVVVDGEIVVADGDGQGLNFDTLSQRIHPAESRVRRLAEETPASFVAFDLLALGDVDHMATPFAERRRVLRDVIVPSASVHVTPASTDRVHADEWFNQFEGAGLDGVVAKRAGDPYTPGKRVLVKVKHERSAECVVAGYRIHKDGEGIGSLLLGLFDETGRLHHVGVTASFTKKFRSELLDEMRPYTENALDGHPWADWANADAHAHGRMPGGVSRWTGGKDLSWVPVRCERVVEVTFGQLEAGRFRHGVKFIRWRPDREPRSCTYDQLDVANPVSFTDFVSASRGERRVSFPGLTSPARHSGGVRPPTPGGSRTSR